jgi:serine/threonine-protein kinase PknG
VTSVACPKPGCPGTLDAEGFCEVDGERPPNWPSMVTGSPQSTTSIGSTFASGSSMTSGSGIVGRGLVTLPALAEVDPDELVLPVERRVIAEHHRRCGCCEREVGRSRAGQPGLARGICPYCLTPYNFEPALKEHERVGRYEIVGPLAHGGVGWVYLAKDTDLDDRRVVLKGLIDTGDHHAVEAAVAERRYLTLLDHPNIVRILDFVTHPDPRTGTSAGYIVMEFVGGRTLERLKAAGESSFPMPVEHIIAYGLTLLDALDYLHSRGYLYCDLKPDNVIHGNQRIRLIDLGAVRLITDRTSPTWGAARYQVPAEEIAVHGLTVRSDLYSAGRTLAELFRNSQDDRNDRTAPGSLSIAEGLTSFRAVLDRATAADWSTRFASATDMAEQLAGALRQITALRGQPGRPEPSRMFAQAVELLDDGLGLVPDLTR